MVVLTIEAYQHAKVHTITIKNRFILGKNS